MRTAWASLNLSTKISLIFTILMVLAVPITVLSVNTVRDNSIRAAGFGGPDPDPTFTLNRDPNYYLTYCVAINDKNNGTYCKQRINIGNAGSYNIYPAPGQTYYWFIDVVSLKPTGDAAVINSGYAEIYKQQFNVPSNCPVKSDPLNLSGLSAPVCKDPATISGWKSNSRFMMQATLHGAIKNACDGAASSCSSNASTSNLDEKTVQFVDFKPGTKYDVYTYINGNVLFDITADLAVPDAGIDYYPKIVQPINYGINIAPSLNLQWQKVAGATYYIVWLSNNSDFGKGVWYNKLQAVDNRCSSDTCNLPLSSAGWASQNLGAVPTQLGQGTQYYWLVWACNASACPNNGRSPQYAFTTSGTAPASSSSDSGGSTPPGTGGSPSTAKIIAPELKSPFDSEVYSKTSKADQRFIWQRVEGAHHYAIWFSEFEDFGKDGLWLNRREGDLCNKGTNECKMLIWYDQNWKSQPGDGKSNFPSAPTSFQSNKKYYWQVWACTSEKICPPEGLSKRISFTTPGYTGQPPTQAVQPPSMPDQLVTTGLNCSSSDPYFPSGLTFNWSSDNATQQYAVDVSESPIFEKGFANKAQPVNLGKSIKNGPTTDPSNGLKDYRWTNRNGAKIVDTEVLKFKTGKTYYWRVWASNGGDAWTYDKQSSTGSPASFTVNSCSTTSENKVTPITSKPSLVTPNPTGGDLPTADQNNQPAFSWSKAENATTYIISVTDNRNNLNPLGARWSSFVDASDCSNICQRNWSDSGKWATLSGASVFPASLKSGSVYYWVVYACNSEGCPTVGQSSISSFVIKGDVISEVEPKNLKPTGSLTNGQVSFSWDSAKSVNGIKTHVLLLKKNNQDFLAGAYKGNFFYKNVSCTSGSCQSDLSGSWFYYENLNKGLNLNPPSPLSAGDWSFVVFGCKELNGCPFNGNTLISEIANFSINAEKQVQAAKISNEPIQGECNKDGTRDVTFSWSPSSDSAVLAQFVDISKYDNNFMNGTFLGSEKLNAGRQTFQWKGLESATPLFWRVNTQIGNSFYTSPTGNFVVKDCNQFKASSLGGQDQAKTSGSEGSGQKNSLGIEIGKPQGFDVLGTYINSIAGSDNLPKSSTNLADFMRGTMWRESRGEDCAYHVDTNANGVATQSTIGVFQFTPDLWQGQDRSGVGSKEALNYVDSGSITPSGKSGVKTAGCWGVPGYDDNLNQTQGQEFWEKSFPGINDDAGVWNPYAQVRAVKAYLLGGYASRWATGK